MLAALAADAMAWPTVSYLSLVLVLAGSWGGGVLLRGVASRQRRMGAGLARAVDALDELEARAIRRERVRLAHELHDLVGHALTAVAIQAGAAKAQLKRGRAPSYDQLAAAARQGEDELRRLAEVLGHDLGEATVAAELARVTATARASGQDVGSSSSPSRTSIRACATRSCASPPRRSPTPPSTHPARPSGSGSASSTTRSHSPSPTTAAARRACPAAAAG